MKEEIPALIQAPAAPARPDPHDERKDAPEAAAAGVEPPAAGVSGPSSSVSSVPQPAARGGGTLAVVLAVAALGTAALAGWQAWQTRSLGGELRTELAGRLEKADTLVTETRALVRQQQETLLMVQGKLGAMESKLAASEGQAAALEALYQEFSRTREERVLAEIEQAVTIAGQQLLLAGNAEAALIALQGAQARLAAQDRGQLGSLRRAISRDIEQLRSMPQLDVQGMAIRLELMLEQVDSMPLAYAGELRGAEDAGPAAALPSPTEAPLEFLRQLGLDVWSELKTLVRVERLDQSEPVLLAPAQSTFLRENVKIRLLTARLALLARDGRNFEADLRQARTWVERFFDQRDQRVQVLLGELGKLVETPLVFDERMNLESVAALRLLQSRSLPGNGQSSGAVPDAEAPELDSPPAAPAAESGAGAAADAQAGDTPAVR